MIRHYTPTIHRCNELCVLEHGSQDACTACETGDLKHYEHTCGTAPESRNPFVLRARANTLPVKVYRG